MVLLVLQGSRYDDNIAVFGRSLQQKMESLNIFLVRVVRACTEGTEQGPLPLGCRLSASGITEYGRIAGSGDAGC